MKMKINVTQEHIDRAIQKGRRSAAFACPIAQALIDEGYREVSVGNERVFVTRLLFSARGAIYERTSLIPSRSAIRFMNRYDKGLEVKPTNFILKSRR